MQAQTEVLGQSADFSAVNGNLFMRLYVSMHIFRVNQQQKQAGSVKSGTLRLRVASDSQLPARSACHVPSKAQPIFNLARQQGHSAVATNSVG